jgi:hypothetical protein
MVNPSFLGWNRHDFSNDNPFPFVIPPAGPSMPPSSIPTYEDIRQKASCLVSPTLANWIAEFLEGYYPSVSERITGPRAGLVPVFTEPNLEFCVMEWREGYDTDVMAFFHPIVDNSAYSCLLHCGGGPWQVDQNRWTNSSLSWYVTNISHLKDLFLAARTMSLLSDSQSNFLQHYLQASNAEPSIERCVFKFHFVLIIRLTQEVRELVSHMVDVNNLGLGFDEISQEVEWRCARKGIFRALYRLQLEITRRDGTRCILLHDKVELPMLEPVGTEW